MEYLDVFNLYKIDLLVILAGGLGSRMTPLSNVAYKGILKIKDTSLTIQTILRAILFGARRILIITDYEDPFFKYVIDKNINSTNIEIITLEETSILDKIKYALSVTKNRICICYGDTYADIDFNLLFKQHKLLKRPMTITVTPYKIPYGTIIPTKNFKVERFSEKPSTDFLINIGYQVLDNTSEIINMMNNQDTYQNFLEIITNRESLSYYIHKGNHETLNTFSELMEIITHPKRGVTL